jgi:hypothetical protein
MGTATQSRVIQILKFNHLSEMATAWGAGFGQDLKQEQRALL